MIGIVLPVLLGGLSLAQGIMGFATARQEAQAARELAEYRRRMLERNKKLAEEEAQLTLLGAENVVQEITKTKDVTIGAQRAAYAAQGVDVTATKLPVIQQSAINALQDIDLVRANAVRTARGLRIQAENYEQEAFFQTLAAARQSRAAMLSGISSLVGGVLGGAAYVGSALNRKDTAPFKAPGKGIGARPEHFQYPQQDKPFG